MLIFDISVFLQDSLALFLWLGMTFLKIIIVTLDCFTVVVM